MVFLYLLVRSPVFLQALLATDNVDGFLVGTMG